MTATNHNPSNHQKRTSLDNLAITMAILVAIFATVYIAQVPLYDWYTTIDTTVTREKTPVAPDYQLESNWAALPDRQDSADLVPPRSEFKDEQATARVDVFYIHPTTAVTTRKINVNTDHFLTNFITDRGVMIQEATIFNGIGKVYAPRYRQVSMSAQRSKIAGENAKKAYDIAQTDIIQAFDFYLNHYNHGRPFIIASHSQGSYLAPKLVQRYLAKSKPYHQQLIAAYLIGIHLKEQDAAQLGLDLCQQATQTHCYLSWDTAKEHSIAAVAPIDRIKGKNICVNPLSWEVNSKKVGAQANLGALPMVGLTGIAPLVPQMFSAQCGENGVLWVSHSTHSGFQKVVGERGEMHTYDFNLFYGNIRQNAIQRTQSYLSRMPSNLSHPLNQQQGEEP